MGWSFGNTTLLQRMRKHLLRSGSVWNSLQTWMGLKHLQKEQMQPSIVDFKPVQGLRGVEKNID